jgi:hypothetical protein
MNNRISEWCVRASAQLGLHRSSRWALVVAAAWTCACEPYAYEPSAYELEGFDGDAAVPLDSTAQALTSITAEWAWSQGQAPVDMGTASNQFCFLTHIQGHFQGGGEMVRVFEENGRVKLGGTSAQTGVAARARCLPLSSNRALTVHAERSWSQGQAKRLLATDDGFTACVLTRVRGHFEGEGEAVEITRENGEWRLGGRSQQTGVAASARCISSVFIAAGTPKVENSCHEETCTFFYCKHARCDGRVKVLGSFIAPAELWGPGQLVACGLGSMSGKFKGGAERVRVFVHAEDGQWELEAYGHQESWFRSSAYCFI